LKLTAISSDELREIIEADFRFSSTQAAFQIGVAAEHLRAIVALEARDPLNEDRYPVPTVRLTHQLKGRISSLGLFKSDELGTTLEELEHLAALSDLVRYDGRWFLGPLRRVEIDSATSLLVGGGPCQSFPLRVRSDIQTAGRARILHFSEKNCSQVEKIPVQRFDDWLGLPYRDINKWCDEFLKSSAKSLSQPFEMEHAMFWTNERWVPIERCSNHADLLLFRKSVTIFGNPASAYGLAHIKRGVSQTPGIVGICEIDRNDARRLQGTVGTASAARRRLQCSRVRELVIIRFPHPLPFPEAKFLSLGWPSISSGTAKVWPKDFLFASKLLPLLERILNGLGYELIQNNDGEN
jgi:hypothetical protein